MKFAYTVVQVILSFEPWKLKTACGDDDVCWDWKNILIPVILYGWFILNVKWSVVWTLLPLKPELKPYNSKLKKPPIIELFPEYGDGILDVNEV